MTTVLKAERIEEIQRESQITTVTKIADYLQETLGQKMTAYISGLNTPKTVGNWAAGRSTPRDMAEIRMRHAFTAVKIIVDTYGVETAKAWLFGTNTRLHDEAPAYVLRHAKQIDDLRDVVPAAKTFASPNE